MLLLYKQFSLLATLNYLPLLLRHPIKPINNLIYLLIRNRNLALNLFSFCGWRKGVFLFVEVKHPVNEGDEFVVSGFFRRVVEVDGADGYILKIFIY